MPNPAWLYHKQRPAGQLYPDLTPELQRTLEQEGWVDTPTKLDGAAQTASSVQGFVPAPAPAPAPLAPQVGDGRVLSEPKEPPPYSNFLPYIGGRLDRLFAPDGTSIADALEDEELARLVDDMSRQELLAVHERLDTGLKDAEGLWASPIRASLFQFLRPDADYESLGGGLVAVAGDDDEEEKVDDDPSAMTLDELKAMSEDDREAWMTKANKADLHAKLDKLEVSYKAKDGKEELMEALRAKLAPAN